MKCIYIREFYIMRATRPNFSWASIEIAIFHANIYTYFGKVHRFFASDRFYCDVCFVYFFTLLYLMMDVSYFPVIVTTQSDRKTDFSYYLCMKYVSVSMQRNLDDLRNVFRNI